MVKEILDNWKHLHPFDKTTYKKFREVAHDALNEIRTRTDMTAFPDVDPRIQEVVVSQWEDKDNPKQLTLKVRVPVFADEEV